MNRMVAKAKKDGLEKVSVDKWTMDDLVVICSNRVRNAEDGDLNEKELELLAYSLTAVDGLLPKVQAEIERRNIEYAQPGYERMADLICKTNAADWAQC